MSTYADQLLERAGLRCQRNRARLIAWWSRWERATGGPPDVMAHVRLLRRGLDFPVARGDMRLPLRPIGQARR